MPVPTGGPCRVASLGGTCRATDIPVTLAIVVCGNAPDLWVISHTWSSSNREVLFEAITLSGSARRLPPFLLQSDSDTVFVQPDVDTGSASNWGAMRCALRRVGVHQSAYMLLLSLLLLCPSN